MATDIVRRGKIILDLETGKTEINAPALDSVTRAKEQQVRLDKELTAEAEKMNSAREKARLSESQWQQQIAESDQRVNRHMMKVGEGFLQLGRAAILLGATSEESLSKLIAGLARVQAAFDILKGAQKITENITKAIKELQLAEDSAAASGLRMVGAIGTATAMALVADILVNAFVDLGVEMAKIAGWEPPIEKMERMFKETEKLIKVFDEAMGRFDRIDALRTAGMSDDEKYEANKGVAAYAPSTEGGVTDKIAAFNTNERRAKAIQENLEIERRRTDEKKRQLDLEIQQIKNADALVDAAKKQMEAEEAKLKSAQATFGQLSALEQQQIKNIRDRLRAGQDISSYEEEQFAKLGGRAAGVIEERRAKRGAAAGFGDDFFDGLAGAGKGVKEAADELKKVVDALNKLTDGLTAGEAVAKLEAEKAALEKQYKEFYTQQKKILDDIYQTMAVLVDEISKLKQAAIQGEK